MVAGMLLDMIADADRPRATLALLILVAVVIGSGDRSTFESDHPTVTTGPTRCFWVHRNYEVPELIGTCDVAEIQSIRPDDRTQ